jgi:hypothetical protein
MHATVAQFEELGACYQLQQENNRKSLATLDHIQ